MFDRAARHSLPRIVSIVLIVAVSACPTHRASAQCTVTDCGGGHTNDCTVTCAAELIWALDENQGNCSTITIPFGTEVRINSTISLGTSHNNLQLNIYGTLKWVGTAR